MTMSHLVTLSTTHDVRVREAKLAIGLLRAGPSRWLVSPNDTSSALSPAGTVTRARAFLRQFGY